MQWRLKRNVAPSERERMRKEIDSCGPNNGITFPAMNVVRVLLAFPGDDEGPAKGTIGVMIENKLAQLGLL